MSLILTVVFAVAKFVMGERTLEVSIGSDPTLSNGHRFRTVEIIRDKDGSTVRREYGDGTDRFDGIVDGFQKRVANRKTAGWTLKAKPSIMTEKEAVAAIVKAEKTTKPQAA